MNKCKGDTTPITHVVPNYASPQNLHAPPSYRPNHLNSPQLRQKSGQVHQHNPPHDIPAPTVERGPVEPNPAGYTLPGKVAGVAKVLGPDWKEYLQIIVEYVSGEIDGAEVKIREGFLF
ncbi:hypothetical protein CC80DRAFT_549632 [Byssothecium circinans]|uniref:Uncharacterized protein n=1 Tax=Byssothecium circinans TaxID=147558 RepID=A0A6A5TSE7_9PLEO|nr:hypothetical protein CC80DRAFT_549632 [Byssothecium circinans]